MKRSQADQVAVSRLVGIVDGDAAHRAALLAEFGPSAVTIVDETTSSCLAPAFIEREATRASDALGRPLDLVSSSVWRGWCILYYCERLWELASLGRSPTLVLRAADGREPGGLCRWPHQSV